jgi:hypothetical protein
MITVLLKEFGFSKLKFIFNVSSISDQLFADARSFNITRLVPLMTKACQEFNGIYIKK